MISTSLSNQLYKPSDNYMNAVETDVLETKVSQNKHTHKLKLLAKKDQL